jgi:hypothetical protein
MLTDFYLDWTVAAPLSRADITTEFSCNNMKPKADSQHGEPEIEILAGVSRSFYCWSTPENDPSASIGYLVRGNRIWNHRYVNLQIPKCPVNEMIKLTKIIDNVDGKHFSDICIEIL